MDALRPHTAAYRLTLLPGAVLPSRPAPLACQSPLYRQLIAGLPPVLPALGDNGDVSRASSGEGDNGDVSRASSGEGDNGDVSRVSSGKSASNASSHPCSGKSASNASTQPSSGKSASNASSQPSSGKPASNASSQLFRGRGATCDTFRPSNGRLPFVPIRHPFVLIRGKNPRVPPPLPSPPPAATITWP